MDMFIAPTLYVIIVWNLEGDKLYRKKDGSVWCTTDYNVAMDKALNLCDLADLSAEVFKYGTG